MTRAKRLRRLNHQKAKKQKQKMSHKNYKFSRLDTMLDVSLSDDEAGDGMFSPDPCGWFTVRGVSLSGIKGACSWCCGSVLSGLSAVGSMFRRENHKEELQQALKKVRELEDELERMKTNNNNEQPTFIQPCQPCSCQTSRHSQPPVPPPPPPPLIGAPPPPPPPPCIVAPPKPLIIKRKGLQARDPNVNSKPVISLHDIQKVKLKRTDLRRTSAINVGKKAKDPNPVITLDDIQNIKLKKADLGRTSVAKVCNKENEAPVITLSAIKKVKLKRTSPDDDKDNTIIDAMRRLPGEILQCKLRKTTYERSPGGTPLVTNRNLDEGTGLTPLMTRALRRKFLFARSPSPSNSRTLSKIEQEL